MAVRNISNPLDIIGEVTGLIGSAMADIGSLVHAVGHDKSRTALLSFMMHSFGHTSKGVQYIWNHPGDIGNWMNAAETELGQPFVWALMTGALGLDMSKAHEVLKFPTKTEIANWEHKQSSLTVDATRGLTALGKLTAFVIGTNLVFAALGGVMKLVLAQRWESQIDASIGHIGEQLGLNWAMGETLGELMQVLTTRQLEEFANVQVHPNRLDMQVLRMLARQHHITQEQFWAGLDLQGYPDDLKALILQMDTQQLLPADLQTLWSIGQMSRAEVETYLGHVGYSDPDVAHLMTLWIDHAESQELAQFRATLRMDYMKGVIGPYAFRDMLAQMLTHPQRVPAIPREGQQNYDSAPDQIKIVIDLAVASADFANHYGRVTVTVAELAKQLKTGRISGGEFVTRAQALGYSNEDAVKLRSIYEIPPLAGKPGLTSAKVLSYTAAGTLTSEQAYSKLVTMGMDNKDAAFLAWNPKASAGTFGFPSTVATVKQAYLDQVIDNAMATERLSALGLGETAIKEELELWHYQLSHPVIMTPKEIKANDHWEAAFRDSLHKLYDVGGVGDAELVGLLEETGLTQTDAYYTWAGWYAERHGTIPGAPRQYDITEARREHPLQ